MVRDLETALAEMQELGVVLDPVTEEAFRAEYDRLIDLDSPEVSAPSPSVVRRTAAQKAAPARKGTSVTARKGATK